MDIIRDTKPQKKKKKLMWGAGAVGLVALMILVPRMLPTAVPSVDAATVWRDTVQHGTMIRQVRGPGTLVPEQMRWITAVTAGRIEQIMSGAHEFAELRLLNALRGGEIELRQEDQVEIETLLGSRGTSLGARLGLDEGGSAEEIRAAYFEALSRWRLRAENPVSSLAVSTASRVMVRSYEGLYQQIADLAPAT